MDYWKTITELDSEMIFNVISQYFLDEESADIELSNRDREMIPHLAMKDLEQGGEPLVEIKINQEKLQQLQAKVKAKQQIAETVGEVEETHSDILEGVYEFCVTDQLAMYHLLMNANAIRQMTGLPDIAPPDLLNAMTAFQFEISEPMRHMAMVTIDLEILKQAVSFARRSELEADKYNPHKNPFAGDFFNSEGGE
ncbi:MAG: hypothetical protein HUJ23_01980 [Methylophaga sp.]|nr:hypothetical protein [Methylophaga sp.]